MEEVLSLQPKVYEKHSVSLLPPCSPHFWALSLDFNIHIYSTKWDSVESCNRFLRRGLAPRLLYTRTTCIYSQHILSQNILNQLDWDVFVWGQTLWPGWSLHNDWMIELETQSNDVLLHRWIAVLFWTLRYHWILRNTFSYARCGILLWQHDTKQSWLMLIDINTKGSGEKVYQLQDCCCCCWWTGTVLW